ncbi:MAG: DUF4177 domain-containing protein [Candidatus Brocadiaceae bacterium]|nr:DUF4177 domain-containing protein [Candidatus Brocadiaceae bacterium]
MQGNMFLKVCVLTMILILVFFAVPLLVNVEYGFAQEYRGRLHVPLVKEDEIAKENAEYKGDEKEITEKEEAKELYEYKVIKYRLKGIPESMLNKYGNNGWELVLIDHEGGAKYLVFKKKIVVLTEK